MLVIFSHILAFCTLFVGSIFDLKTTEVPDTLNAVGVVGGLILHLGASIPSMQPGIIFSPGILLGDPSSWIGALGDPLLWSLGVGIVFSIYGWGLYLVGMWGGADAFAMSVLGFAAPYSLQGYSIGHPLSLFMASLLLGLIYTILFAVKYAVDNPSIFSKTWERLIENERRISIELIAASFFSGFVALSDLKMGLIYYIIFFLLVILARFLKTVQEDGMKQQIPVEELDGGEVLAREEEIGGRVKGLTEEDISNIEKDTVTIREGLKFVPVFPASLFVVDVLGFSIEWFLILIS